MLVTNSLGVGSNIPFHSNHIMEKKVIHSFIIQSGVTIVIPITNMVSSDDHTVINRQSLVH